MPMRQLRSCDFCGDEAAGVYEVVPPELSPTEAEQRRLVLCESCVGTLERTLEPLLARLGVDRGGDGPDANAEPARSGPTATSQTAADEPDSPTDSDSPDELGTDLVGDRRSLPYDDAEGVPEATDDADSPDRATTAGGADRLEDGTESISAPTDEVARDTGEAVRDTEDAVRDVSPPGESGDDSLSGSAAAETGGDDGEATTTASGESAADAPSTADAATDEEPEDFRTVMRLLGNREFPVDRAEIVELAESAYELDEAHVEQILAHAVDRGLINDDGEMLRRV